MPAFDRRRRGRRRNLAPLLVTLGVVTVVALVLIGGIAHVASSSTGFHRDVNRSFAAQASTLSAESQTTGQTLRRLVVDLPAPTMQRSTLQQSLDELVLDTGRQADEARALSSSAASGGVPASIFAVLAARADATSDFRATLDALLGMTPVPLQGTRGGSRAGSTPTLLPSDRAVAQLSAVGRDLAAADTAYARARRQLAEAPGRADLGPSRWVTDPQLWSPGPVGTLIGQVLGSPSLAVHHQLVLAPNAVRLEPNPVPAPPAPGTPAPAGASVLLPTNHLAVSAVVVNQGNVPEAGVTVTATLSPADGTAAQVVRQSLDLRGGTSSVVAFPPLRTDPGHAYTLSIAITPPAAQTDRSALSVAYPLTVASGTTGR